MVVAVNIVSLVKLSITLIWKLSPWAQMSDSHQQGDTILTNLVPGDERAREDVVRNDSSAGEAIRSDVRVGDRQVRDWANSRSRKTGRRKGEGNESHQRLELAHGEERANEEEATEGTGEKAKERSLLEDERARYQRVYMPELEDAPGSRSLRVRKSVESVRI